MTASDATAAASHSTTIQPAKVARKHSHYFCFTSRCFTSGWYCYVDCNCDPAGVVEEFAGCGSVPKGELCQCKERVQGRICNKCKPLFWNMQTQNPLGCEDCDCNTAGTVAGLRTCDSDSGQCVCKPNVQSRRCAECVDGFFHLQVTH